MPPFEWREYLELAQFLVTNPESISQEAALRCATSRAYYAAFCHARNFAHTRHRFIFTGTDADHKNVRDHFERQGMGHLADKLDTLRQWRNQCDYKDEVFQLSYNTERAIRDAQSIFDHLVMNAP